MGGVMSSELIGNIGKTTLAVYVGVVLCLGVTTFLSPLVYGSWWFILLWIIFAATLAIGMWQSGMWRRPDLFFSHLYACNLGRRLADMAYAGER